MVSVLRTAATIPYHAWMNTRVGERTFAYASPAAWNQLPESIRQLQTTSFKHKVK